MLDGLRRGLTVAGDDLAHRHGAVKLLWHTQRGSVPFLAPLIGSSKNPNPRGDKPTMSYWLLKTEPNDYSWADLERDGGTVWDGVKNNLALKHMRGVKSGDRAFIYHTGKERAVIGIAEVTSDPYPDPESDNERFIVFDIAPERALERGVTLAEIKADDVFADFALVRMSRLSAMPVPAKLWKRIEKMGR